MKSIRMKLMTMVVFCILTTVLIISVVSVRTSSQVVNKNAYSIMSLECSNTQKEINAMLSRIDQSVNSLSSYILSELDSLSKFRTDKTYVQEYTQRIESVVFNAANYTEGALTVYVRYNPEFTEPTSGLFGTRDSVDSAFAKVTPTDFSMYDPSDVAHVGWYYVPVQNGKATWMNPYVNENLGINMISYVIPLTKDGVSIGIVGMDIDFSKITSLVDSTKVYNTGYAFLTDTNGIVLHHNSLELNTDLSQVNSGEMAGLAQQFTNVSNEGVPLSYTFNGEKKQMLAHSLDNEMRLVLTAPQYEIEADARGLAARMLGISLAALLITVCASLFVIQRMVKPIQELSNVAKKVGEGDLDVIITHVSKDEVGTLALNFGKAITRLREYIGYIDEISMALDQMAEGSLDFDLKQSYVGEFAKIKHALDKVSRMLGHTILEIKQISNLVASSAEQVSSGANTLSQGAAAQATSIDELGQTVSNITKQIEEDAQSAVAASQLSNEAGENIVESNQKMQEMMGAMNEITRMSNEIGKIIKAIDDIAMQTNILALNAAVEAARAGAAGKGFAVVADEVRNLAQKSASAVKETTSLVEQTMRAIINGTTLADRTALALQETVTTVSSVNTRITMIAQATERQKTSILQVEDGMESIANVVQSNSSAAEESAATSMELSKQAQNLNRLVGYFRLDEQFVTRVEVLEDRSLLTK